ncbi:MAG: hypothetical protein MUD14_28760, partial [Hydrococcus sp. Prado102]|nr:hypothetical protein [Hydrococcus sp. Prado102]
AHLTSSLFLIYLTLLYKFSFRLRSKPEALFHLITGFWVCSSSYYGYILIPTIAFLCIIKNLDSIAARPKFLYVKAKLLTLRYIFAGMAIAILVYVCQLSYLGYFSKLNERFLERSSDRGWDSVQKITIIDFVKSVWYNLSYYLPIGSNNLTDGFVGLLSFLVVLALSLYLVTKISINKKELFLSLGLITIPAIAYVTLLMNYTYVHHFSNFKLALPLIFFCVVLPLTGMAYYFNNLLNQRLKSPLILCAVVFSIIFLSKSVSPRFVAFAGVTDKSPQEFGTLVVNNIAEDELPVSDSLPVGISFQPYWQWYAKRLVYKTQREQSDIPFQPEKEHDSLAEFRDWIAEGKVNLNNVRLMKPVYIEYTDKTNSSSFNNICQGYWNQVKETVIGRNISICRSPKLKEALFGKDLN